MVSKKVADQSHFGSNIESLLLYVLNILGPENATFWANFCYFSLTRL